MTRDPPFRVERHSVRPLLDVHFYLNPTAHASLICSAMSRA